MWKAESTKLRERQKCHMQQQMQQQQLETPFLSSRGVVNSGVLVDPSLLNDIQNADAVAGDHYVGPAYHGQEPTTMTLRMSPEDSLQTSNSSCRFFQWKPWLTKCIRAYYNTGILRIPDECKGDDILLALEYFGILTASPETFVFDSRRAYERIQCWSRYFTYRTELAENLLEDYDAVLEEEEQMYDRGDGSVIIGGVHVWVLFPELPDNSIVNEDPALQVGGMHARKLEVGTIGGLYDLFLGDRDEEHARTVPVETNVDTISRQMPRRFRRDFCEYLRQSMPPRTSVAFELEDVHFRTNTADVESQEIAIEVRPVIRVRYDEGDSPPSFLGILQRQQLQGSEHLFDVRSEGGKDEKGKSTACRSRDSNSCMNQDANSTSKSVHLVSIQTDGIEISNYYTPKASPSYSRSSGWKNPGSEFDSSTNRSPHTKTVATLAGEGIASTNVLLDPLSLTKTIMFPESPEDGENWIPSDFDGIRPRIGHCEMEEDPLSPSQTMWHRNTELNDDVVVEQLEIQNLKKTPSDVEESVGGDQSTAPVKYINTEYGDLRSVTSMLSEPAYNDLYIGDFRMATISEIAKRAFGRVGERSAAIRIIGERALPQMPSHSTAAFVATAPGIEVQKGELKNENIVSVPDQIETFPGIISTPPRTRRSIQNSPPWKTSDVSRDGGVEETKEEVETQNMDGMGDSQPTANNLNWDGNQQKKQEVEGELQVRTETSVPVEANGYWGYLLASVCESVVPAPSNQERPGSPVRYITLETSLPRAPSKENSTKSEKPYLDCPCRSEPESVLVTDVASSWLSTFTTSEPADPASREGLYNVPNPDEFLDKARELGSNLSSHIDALMKIAYDNDREHARSPRGSRRSKLSSIPEEIPILPSDEDRYGTPNYSASGSKSRRRKVSSSSGHLAVSDLSSSICFAIPKNQSFDSDSLGKNISMPPHPGDSRRTRREKQTVARKKASHTASSPKSSSRSSHDGRSVIRSNLAMDKPRAKGTRARTPPTSSGNDGSYAITGAKIQQLM
jgi:hypothetical protein